MGSLYKNNIDHNVHNINCVDKRGKKNTKIYYIYTDICIQHFNIAIQTRPWPPYVRARFIEKLNCVTRGAR